VSSARCLAVVLLVGCGPKPEEMAKPEPRPAFFADAIADGPALLARATVNGGDVEVQVIGRSLGEVLGYAFTVRFDGLQANGDAIVAEAIGPNAYGEAVYLSRLSGGALAIGGARQGAAAGGRQLDAETELARLKLRLTGETAALRLGGTSVRRVNGDAVVVAAAGGKIRVAP
jgi:hypothetical protein